MGHHSGRTISGSARSLTGAPSDAESAPGIGAGALFGVVAFDLFAFGLLRPMSVVAMDADSVKNMASIVGYPTFLAEHVLFGLVLGAFRCQRDSVGTFPGRGSRGPRLTCDPARRG